MGDFFVSYLYSDAQRVLSIIFLPFLLCISNVWSLDNIEFDNDHYQTFIESYPKTKQDQVRSLLESYTYKPRIIELITKPSEKLSWPQYEKLLVNTKRLEQGNKFMRENAKILWQVYEKYGVPPRILSALIGVETSYGQNTGSWKVGDALKTLSFTADYSRRGFFQKELGIYLDKVLDGALPNDLQGSYAGAFGLTQFIPSSYASYAVPFDDSASYCNLMKLEDALASTGSYLKKSGWKKHEKIAEKIAYPKEVLSLEKSPNNSPKPRHVTKSYGEIENQQIEKFSILDLPQGEDFWVGFQNFYAITRYNHSTNYAMAIFQISEHLVGTECEIYGQALS